MQLPDNSMILVVDPTSGGCHRVCGLFGCAGYLCVPAHDPIDAIAKATRFSDVRVAVLDAQTPALAAMVAQLRARRPELVLLGQCERDARRETFDRLPVHGVLEKPWELEDFLSLEPALRRLQRDPVRS